MERKPQHPPDSGVRDDQATEVIAEARKMPLGERRGAALRAAGRLRVAAEMNRWLPTEQGGASVSIPNQYIPANGREDLVG
jgi:hypothetical protein